MTIDELMAVSGEVINGLEEIKREVRRRNEHLYERWKAGGFMVDSGFVSMYPTLEEVVEEIEKDAEAAEDIAGDEIGESLGLDDA